MKKSAKALFKASDERTLRTADLQTKPAVMIPAFKQFGLEFWEHKCLSTSQAISN
jgi:hypothetical protein